MKYVLWVLQILLALWFLMAGGAKVAPPMDDVIVIMPWAADLPAWLVRFIGVAEVLGALGLILPAATRVQPWLTSLAAAGLALVMLLATAFNLSRGDVPGGITTLVLLFLAAFVAYGRRSLAPIAARGAAAPAG